MSKNLEECIISELRTEIDNREFAAGYLDSDPETITGVEANKVLEKLRNR